MNCASLKSTRRLQELDAASTWLSHETAVIPFDQVIYLCLSSMYAPLEEMGSRSVMVTRMVTVKGITDDLLDSCPKKQSCRPNAMANMQESSKVVPCDSCNIISHDSRRIIVGVVSLSK